MASEDAILRDIIDRLVATSHFDAVYDEEAELRGQASGDLAVAVVGLVDLEEMDGWQDAAGAKNSVTGRFRLELIVRNDDARLRRARLFQLQAVVMNAINGQSLATLTLPPFTRLRRGRLQPPRSPEQTLSMQGEFLYLVVGHASHDTTL